MKKNLLLIIFLFLQLGLFAQKSPAITDTYLRRTITCMLADDSVLWIGTSYGMMMYNLKTKSVSAISKGALTPFTGIKSITPDNKGNKWIITTDNKLIKYSKAGAQNTALPDGLDEYYQIFVKNDKPFILYYDTYTDKNFFSVYQNNVWTNKTDTILKNSRFQCVDNNGNAWFLHNDTKDLWRYDFSKWKNYGRNDDPWPEKESDHEFTTIVENTEENVTHIIGGFDYYYRAVYESDVAWLSKYKLDLGYDLPGYDYRTLVLDKKKHPWIGTNDGYFYEGDEEWHMKEGLDILNMCVDENNWMILLTKEFEDVTEDDIEIYASVKRVYPDSMMTLLPETILSNEMAYLRKSIFVHSDKYLYRITDQRIDTIELGSGRIPYFMDIALEKTSSTVFASSSDGIYQVKKSGFVPCEYNDTMYSYWPHTKAFMNFTMHVGRLFVSNCYKAQPESVDGPSYSNGGLAYIENGKIGYNNFNAFSLNDGDHICSYDGYLWMYSFNYKALFRMWDVNNDKLMDSVNYFPAGKFIRSMFSSSDSGIYIIYEDGFDRIKKNDVKNYFIEDIPALKGLNFFDGALDRKNRLYILCTNGAVARFANNNWSVIQPASKESPYGSFAIDQYNRLWVGYSDALFMYDGTKWNNVSKTLNIPSLSFSLLKIINDKLYAYGDAGLIIISL